MKVVWKDFVVYFLFIIITIFIFSSYVFSHQIPFPANLLVSTYEPWLSYPSREYPNGAPNKPVGFDNLRIYYPLRKLAIDQIKNWQIPLWNPYAFSGNTLLATYQSAIFHPFSWLFLLISRIDAWSIIILLQPTICSSFMYLYLRSVKLSRFGSFFGAISFSLSGFSIVWWEESYMSGYSAMALPMLLLGVEKIINKEDLIGFLLITFFCVWSIMSGWFQMSLYVFGFTGLYLLKRLLQKKISLKQCRLVFIAFVTGIMISSIHLIPGFEALIYSARGVTNAKYLFDEYLMPFSHLVTLLAPDFFGNPASYNYFGKGFYYERMANVGILPFMFLLYGLLDIKNKSKPRFWLICSVVFLSLGYNLPTSWLPYILRIPLISVMIPSRIFFLSTFCISVVAAYIFDSFSNKIKWRKLGITFFIFLVSLSILWVYSIWQKNIDPMGYIAKVSIRNLVIPTTIVVLVFLGMVLLKLFHIKRKIILISIMILSLSQALYFSKKYVYFSDPNLVFTETPVIEKLEELAGNDRVWSFGSGYLENNFATYYNLQSPDGYDSFFISRYGELLYAASHNGQLTSEITRADAKIDSIDRIDRILDNPYRSRILSLLGIKYIFGHTKQPLHVEEVMVPPREFRQLWTDGKYVIYENTLAFPRAYIVNEYKVETNPREELEQLFDLQTEIRSTVFLEKDPGEIKTTLERSEAVIKYYSPNEVHINVNTNSKSILVLSDNWYPGWQAYINGKQTEIYRANYSFRAAIIPKGESNVIFRYEPLSWQYGVILSGTGIIFLLFAIRFILKRC